MIHTKSRSFNLWFNEKENLRRIVSKLRNNIKHTGHHIDHINLRYSSTQDTGTKLK